MEVTIIKYLIEAGVLGIIAYFYFKGNKKRDEQQEEILNKALDKSWGKIATEDGPYISVIEELRDYQTKNIKEHNELKKFLKENQTYFKEIKNEMADLYALWKRGEDVESKRKHYQGVIRAKIGDVLPFFNEEKLRIFIVEQCVNFGDWIMDAMTYMFNSEKDLKFAIEKLKTLCNVMYQKCKERFSDEICIKLEKAITKKLELYINKVETLRGETINDKINRFFNLSILFMQDISSDMLKAWSSTTNKEPTPIVTMDGLEELRRIEKKILNINNKTNQ